MAKVITQETFDDVVKENIVEFSMSVEESRDETVKQFEAQGINLSNIIKDLNLNADSGVPLLNEALEWLKSRQANLGGENPEDVCKQLEALSSECKLVRPWGTCRLNAGRLRCGRSLTLAECFPSGGPRTPWAVTTFHEGRNVSHFSMTW